MKQLSNPFVIGKYVDKEYFCDRVKESETLVHHIEMEETLPSCQNVVLAKLG